MDIKYNQVQYLLIDIKYNQVQYVPMDIKYNQVRLLNPPLLSRGAR